MYCIILAQPGQPGIRQSDDPNEGTDLYYEEFITIKKLVTSLPIVSENIGSIHLIDFNTIFRTDQG